MTAVPQSPLVEKVATAIATRRAQSQVPRRLFHIEYAAPTAEDTRDAQAALAACHAEELAAALRQSVTELEEAGKLLAASGLAGTASIISDAVTRHRALLAKLDGRS